MYHNITVNDHQFMQNYWLSQSVIMTLYEFLHVLFMFHSHVSASPLVRLEMCLQPDRMEIRVDAPPVQEGVLLQLKLFVNFQKTPEEQLLQFSSSVSTITV